MRLIRKKLAIFVLAILFLQLVLPITSAFAASNLTAPLNLRYYPDGVDNVLLRWDAVTGATNYRVYEIKDEEKVLLFQVTNNYKYLTSVTEGTHTYAVTAVNSTGESPLSAYLPVVIKYPVMQSPSGLTSTITNGNDVTLKWNATEFATGYKIYEVKNGIRELLTTTTKTGQYYANVSEGDRVYEVTSYNTQFGESAPSSVAVNIVFPEMAAPAGLNAYINDINNVLLRWQAVSFAESYKVYQLVNGERTLVATTTELKQYISGLPAGENVFEVTAYNARYGETTVGSKTAVNVVYPVINAPEQIYPYFYNGNDLLLMWSAAPYADQYKLYLVKDGEKELLTTTSNRSHYLSNLPEGDYTFELVSVSERFGESPAKPFTVTVDFPQMQAPKISLLMDTNNSGLIGWSSVPYATEYEIYKIVDGEPQLITTTDKTSYYVSNLEQGNHEYTVIAKSDRFGKSGYSNIVVAEVKPLLDAPKPAEPAVNGNEVTLAWEEVPEASFYNVYKVVDGERILVGGASDTSFTVKEEEEGSYVYVVVPVTADGTESIAYAEIPVEIGAPTPTDVTAPVTVAEPTLDWSNSDVAVTLNATDDLSGVKSTFYAVDNGEFVEGTELLISEAGIHTVSFYSVDNAGNVEGVNTVQVKIDKEAPITTIDTADYWYNTNVNVKLTAVDQLSGVKATYYSVDGGEFVKGTDFALNEEGVHTIQFYSIDNAGNFEEAKTVEVKVDNHAPVTSANTNVDWYNHDVLVELTAVDDLSGVYTTYYSVNGSELKEGTSFIVDQEGVNTVTFYSVDYAGNIEGEKTIEVKVDKTAPTTASNVEDKWYSDIVNVELSSSDELSGVKSTYYSINGSEFTEGTTFTLEAEGVHNITFYSIDNAGNVEEAKQITVKIDKTAPTISASIDSQYSLGTVLDLNYEGVDSLSGIKETFVEVNGVLNTTGKVSFDKPGEYVIKITAIDQAGLVTVVEKTVSTFIQATIEVLPKVINGNKGEFMVQVILPKGLTFSNVDLSKVTLNNIPALKGTKGLENQAKKGQFKFNREDFVWDESEELLELRVVMDGQVVVGSKTVKVIK
ncbi:OmpL47-type beta-barrel domain-containing protein [Neobacillus sp. LXY-4]|uniref:OmpL47-type beta-barrel domain-containing protein n=1 Tax=Neobacillus sp. LXY-4 TaxID=3379826 RepID=UPI003EE0196F